MNQSRALFVLGYVIFMIAFFGVMWTFFAKAMVVFFTVLVCIIIVAAIGEGVREYINHGKDQS